MPAKAVELIVNMLTVMDWDTDEGGPHRLGGRIMAGRGISLEQKLQLVAAYGRNGGCVADAMRQADIASRKTAYLWLQRYRDGGAMALQPRSHARYSSSRVADDLAAEAAQLRREHREWGRRRIAQELQRQHGSSVIGPSGVEAALKRAGLWADTTPTTQRARPPTLSVSGAPTLGAMVDAVRQGLVASQAHRARDAARILHAGLWATLRLNEVRTSRWLRDPQVGALLLRGLVQFGHSLMNVGEWLRAEQVLGYTASLLDAGGGARRRGDKEERWLGMSLWRDDLWLEAHQYLGIVSRERDPVCAQHHLEAALDALDRTGYGRREASHDDAARSNIERDLAVLLRHQMERGKRVTLSQISQHLRRSNECLRSPPWPGMHAAWLMEQARLAGFEAMHADAGLQRDGVRARDAMGAHIVSALEEVAREDSPMLSTKIAVDAADLQAQHGIPIDKALVQVAATACLRFGYGHQAAHILSLPRCESLIGEQMVEGLRRLADSRL